MDDTTKDNDVAGEAVGGDLQKLREELTALVHMIVATKLENPREMAKILSRLIPGVTLEKAESHLNGVRDQCAKAPPLPFNGVHCQYLSTMLDGLVDKVCGLNRVHRSSRSSSPAALALDDPVDAILSTVTSVAPHPSAESVKANTLGDSEKPGVAKGGVKSATESGETTTSKRKMSVSNDTMAVDGAKEEDGNSAKKQKLGPEEVIVIDDSDDSDSDDNEVEYVGVKQVGSNWKR